MHVKEPLKVELDDIFPFQAWKRAVSAPAPFSYLDHTCVVVSLPEHRIDMFQCGGHDDDLRRLTPVAGVGGEGNHTVANTHRVPPADLAGMEYLIHGVCHQAANRFLSCVPGQPTLNNTVHGYVYSTLWFGVYGKNWTPWMTDDRLVRDFLNQLVSLGIDANLEGIRASHEKALTEKARLDALHLSEQERAKHFDEISDNFQRELMANMPPEDYERLMGVPPGQILRLTDPEHLDQIRPE